MTSESVLPFVNSAIQRYHRNSTIRRVTAIAPDALRADILSTVFYLEPGTKLPEDGKWAGVRIILNFCLHPSAAKA